MSSKLHKFASQWRWVRCWCIMSGVHKSGARNRWCFGEGDSQSRHFIYKNTLPTLTDIHTHIHTKKGIEKAVSSMSEPSSDLRTCRTLNKLTRRMFKWTCHSTEQHTVVVCRRQLHQRTDVTVWTPHCNWCCPLRDLSYWSSFIRCWERWYFRCSRLRSKCKWPPQCPTAGTSAWKSYGR